MGSLSFGAFLAAGGAVAAKIGGGPPGGGGSDGGNDGEKPAAESPDKSELSYVALPPTDDYMARENARREESIRVNKISADANAAMMARNEWR